MDKIGLEGVAKELEEEGFAKESIDTYLAMFKEISLISRAQDIARRSWQMFLTNRLQQILRRSFSTVEAVKTADFKMAFDPTLVRGMSYYTGPIFEISMDEFGGSVGGGGRYDEMIGKFTGNNTSACGFSIDLSVLLCSFLKEDIRFLQRRLRRHILLRKYAVRQAD